MIKYYERTLWKSNAYDFQNKKPMLVLVTEYVATDDIKRFNYRKKIKFEESPYAERFFKEEYPHIYGYYDYLINHVYEKEHRN